MRRAHKSPSKAKQQIEWWNFHRIFIFSRMKINFFISTMNEKNRPGDKSTNIQYIYSALLAQKKRPLIILIESQCTRPYNANTGHFINSVGSRTHGPKAEQKRWREKKILFNVLLIRLYGILFFFCDCCAMFSNGSVVYGWLRVCDHSMTSIYVFHSVFLT